MLSRLLTLGILISTLVCGFGFADEQPVTMVSGSSYADYNDVAAGRGKDRAIVQVQVETYRKLVEAYVKCKASKNVGFISIPKKEATCKRQEHQPRGQGLGSCSFEGTMICVSAKHMEMREEDRIGDAMDLINGSRTLTLSNGENAKFDDLAAKLKD